MSGFNLVHSEECPCPSCVAVDVLTAWVGDPRDPDLSGAAAIALAELARLRAVESAARDYVESVDRGRELGIGGLGLPILHFQPLRAALEIPAGAR